MGRQGVRASWDEVPASFRAAVESTLGARVVSATNAVGGFSPGPAATCALSDGRTVFIKAGGLGPNPSTPAMHRREGGVLRSLPDDFPAPSLIDVVDDGDWIALIIARVEGTVPETPLRRHTAERVLRLAERLADLGEHVDFESLTDFTSTHHGLTGNWRKLGEAPLDGLDRWSLRHLDTLADLEAGIDDAAAGTHLLHVDLRVDNMLIDQRDESCDVVVDWPGACLGAPWVDLVGLLPSLHLDGGPPPNDAFTRSRLGRTADARAVDTVLASIAGYFTRNALLPPPPGLPTLRRFQAAQGAVTRAWLAQRLGR